jgi:hypothetical protein
MKLQHNYKIENKITLNYLFTLPSSSHQSPNGDLHKQNENQGREWCTLEEWNGEGLGFWMGRGAAWGGWGKGGGCLRERERRLQGEEGEGRLGYGEVRGLQCP